jgi:hypothetical protein
MDCTQDLLALFDLQRLNKKFKIPEQPDFVLRNLLINPQQAELRKFSAEQLKRAFTLIPGEIDMDVSEFMAEKKLVLKFSIKRSDEGPDAKKVKLSE